MTDRPLEQTLTGARLDPRLTRLVEGTLSAEERRRLEEDARRDPELARQVEAFTPLGEAANARAARAALSALEGPRRPPAKRRLAQGAAVALAAAACALLWITVLRGPPPAPIVRLEPDDLVQPDAPVTIVVRPPEGAAFHRVTLLVDQAGGWRLAGTLAEPGPEGEWTMQAPASQLTGGQFGEVDLAVAVNTAPEDLRGRFPVDDARVVPVQITVAPPRHELIALDTGPATHRGPSEREARPLVFSGGRPLRFRLRPEVPVRGGLQLVVRAGPDHQPVAGAEVRRTQEGVLDVSVPPESLTPYRDQGSFRLEAWIGPEATPIPSSPAPGGPWRVVPATVQVESAP